MKLTIYRRMVHCGVSIVGILVVLLFPMVEHDMEETDDLVTWWVLCQGDKPVKQLSLHLDRACAEAKFYRQIWLSASPCRIFFLGGFNTGSTRSSLLLMEEILHQSPVSKLFIPVLTFFYTSQVHHREDFFHQQQLVGLVKPLVPNLSPLSDRPKSTWKIESQWRWWWPNWKMKANLFFWWIFDPPNVEKTAVIEHRMENPTSIDAWIKEEVLLENRISVAMFEESRISTAETAWNGTCEGYQLRCEGLMISKRRSSGLFDSAEFVCFPSVDSVNLKSKR